MSQTTKHHGPLGWFTDLYPVWLLAFALVGLLRPSTLLWFRGPWVVWALSLVMLGMGFTLTVEDFRRLFRMPGSLALGFLAHYTIMPLSGWTVARLLNLDGGFAVGLILLASCPSGTASNVISYLARANVALAVMVTLTSTLLAFLMTPLWCKVLAGSYVPVNALQLCLSTLQVAVAPVLAGVFCNWRFPRAVASVSRIGPLISVVALMFITGSIVAQNADAVIASAGKLTLAAVLLHSLGFGVGYSIARMLGYAEDIARTVSIEVGMQNGGLAAVLARENFPLQPMAAVPAVFSAITQTVLGSLVASWWRAHSSATAPDTPMKPRSTGTGPLQLPSSVAANPRKSIYYWKCDRPAAFHGTGETIDRKRCESLLLAELKDTFVGKEITLRSANGQGNHITWVASIGGTESFLRIEDGPERDDYLEVESRVLNEVRALGVPAPKIRWVDATRTRVPFAWQALEMIPCPDMNHLYKAHQLDLNQVAGEIGAAVARWQTFMPPGFGPFDIDWLRREGRLRGYHSRYEDYFLLQLQRHLRFLEEREFLSADDARELYSEILLHRSLLALKRGCLVHKDLALWNILGTSDRIAAFIDWDDAISGDPMDDLSLLGCFHDGRILARVLEGYVSVRPLPDEHLRRFWLHLLRNMIVKAVIRVGARYFDRTDKFFLIGAGSSGADLREFTHDRIAAALGGLREQRSIETL